MNNFQQATVSFGSRKVQLKQACFGGQKASYGMSKFSSLAALLLILFVATIIAASNAVASRHIDQKPKSTSTWGAPQKHSAIVYFKQEGSIHRLHSDTAKAVKIMPSVGSYNFSSPRAVKNADRPLDVGMNLPPTTTAQSKEGFYSLCSSYQKWTTEISFIELRRPIVKLLQRCDRIGQQLGKLLAHQFSTLALFLI